ncbi:hypothetical protein [Burkholderia multivorans]|uniref:hypothetical protein n=1 Tax=Burkholderia multivorans TaxID=87883 RepID=UPI0012DF3641|nr:hypothetical protein [Burkholderia multivorans]MBN6728721.1 hypothetical protein [Burkholderia multivorans]MBN6737655.1 hypothetical protein [Burkholderia multivorans]MBN7129115.1 hypothetical protein [Burkholderia multivorans]MBN8162423.1 hypothetical protein [Burkholderia multivorans]MBN8170192.1 hypothetical protein [Burkholderia multivorans]
MYSFVEHTVLAEVAELRADQAGCDSGLAALIAQVGKPIVELRGSQQSNHARNVPNWVHFSKVKHKVF